MGHDSGYKMKIDYPVYPELPTDSDWKRNPYAPT